MSDNDGSLTVVVTRVIKPGCEAAFEKTMKEFLAIAWTFPGHLGMQMLRPAQDDQTGEYTVLARFDSLASRRIFTSSEVFREWMARMAEQSVGEPVVRELSGVDGWEALAGGRGNPPRWKMAVTVWMGVAGLSQLFALLLSPFMAGWPRQLQMLPISVLTVAALTWIVLPPAMKLLHGWYFPKTAR